MRSVGEDVARFAFDRDGPMVTDTTQLRFIDLTGHRSLRAVLWRPDGTRDPRVVDVAGEAVTGLEWLADARAPAR